MTKFRFLLINMGITALMWLLDKVTFAPLRNYLQYLAFELQKVIEVLTDSNPDNAAQIKAIWDNENKVFFEKTIETTITFTPNVKDARLRYIIKNVLLDIKTAYVTGDIPKDSLLDNLYKNAEISRIKIETDDDIIF